MSPKKEEEKKGPRLFLASQDALEVMLFTYFLPVSWLADLTDVTLVSDDT